MRNRICGRTGALLLFVLLAVALAPFQLGWRDSAAVAAQTQPVQRQRRLSPAMQTPPAPPAPNAPQQDDDDEVVRVETDLTSILMTAVDKNKRFITTLKQEDIRVLENGAPQQISIFQRETDLPLSLALLIDTSRSQERTLPDEQSAARSFLDAVLRPGKDNAAVISFTGEPRSEQSLTDNALRLRAAVERVRVELPPDNPECDEDVASAIPVDKDPRCWTAIWDAAYATIDEVLSHTPERTRRAIILLSDGDDTGSRTKRQEAIDFAVKSNVVVYSIGIGDRELYDIDEGALRKVSEQTGGRAFFPRNRTELTDAFRLIEQELRSQYLVAYSPANKTRDGSFRRVQIEITNPELRKQKLRLLYRQGYYARK
ncbi:MAG TPA: VWA domain-containing protein [Pyrinomonadaceae bacterium]|jgi:VWFA-related protein